MNKMKEMPTQPLLADEEYIYIPETDDWKVEKKSGSKKLSKKDNPYDSAICPSCGKWAPTDFTPEELKEREWECLDCANKRLTHPEDLPENRGQKQISTFDPEYEFLIKLVNVVTKAGVPAQEIKALSLQHPFVTIDDAGDLAAQIWSLATEKYQIPREWLMKKLPERKASLKKAYEGGYPSQEDATYFGWGAPYGTTAYEPAKYDSTTGLREGDDGEPIVICPKCKSDKVEKEGEQVKCQGCGTNFIPEPDRGSDDPTVNDYSQNYFWGPNDLGRSHQNQPGANGWLPAGTEDMDGPSPNSRMSSLNKKASVEEAWVAPDGKIFPVGAEHHDEWIALNTDILKEYGYSEEELEALNHLNLEDLSMEGDDILGFWFEKLIRDGWIRINEGSGKAQFVIHVAELTHLPTSLDTLIAENFNPNDKRPIDIGTHERHISVHDPFPSIQKAVNRVMRQPAMSAFKSFMHKQSVLNIIADGNVYVGKIDFLGKKYSINVPADKLQEYFSVIEKMEKTKDPNELELLDEQRSNLHYDMTQNALSKTGLTGDIEAEAAIVEVISNFVEREFREGFYRESSLNKVAHCGPCSVLKMEALHILIDLYYKDNDLFPEEVLEELSVAATELKLDNFNDILESVITEYLEEKADEVGEKLPKLKNLLIALKDIAPKLGKEIEVVDKQETVEKEADLKEYSNKVTKLVNDYIVSHPNIMHEVIEASKSLENEEELYFWMKERLWTNTPDIKRVYLDYEGPDTERILWNELAHAWFNTVKRDEPLPGSAIIDIQKLPTLDKAKKLDELLDQLSVETDPRKQEQIKQHINRIKNASLNKQANPPSRFWIAPDGKEFEVYGNHGLWINNNLDILNKEYGIQAKDRNDMYLAWDRMLKTGWTRISNEPAGTGFVISVQDIRNIPPYVDNFVAENFKQGDVVKVGNGGGPDQGQFVEIDNPFPSLQKAVNKELMHSKQASLLDEVLDQTTQDAIAAEYGPQMLIAMRFYNDAVRYGQDPTRSMNYALEEVKRMHRPVDQKNFLEVLNTYF